MLIKLNSKFIIHNSRRGALNIALIITISLVLMIITITLQALTLLTVRVARTSVAEKASFYAAEGLIYDSIARMNASFDGSQFTWPSVDPLDDSVNSIANININRKIDKDEPGLGEYEIDIQASTDQSTRRLVATLNTNLSAAGTRETDIIFLLESSRMMAHEGSEKCDDWNNPPYGGNYSLNCSSIQGQWVRQPLYAAQSAIEYFIDLIIDPTNNYDPNKIQTSIIPYHTTVSPPYPHLHSPLTKQHDQTKQFIYSFTNNSHSNIQYAINNALNEFNLHGQIVSGNPAKRVIIIFSAGFPNYDSGNYCNYPADINSEYPTLDDYTGIAPNPPSINTTCIDNALAEADLAKTNDIFIYTIGLGLLQPHSPTSPIQAGQIDLAHYVLDSLASYPTPQYAYYFDTINNWPSETYLQEIMAQILSHILSTPYFTIEEKPA